MQSSISSSSPPETPQAGGDRTELTQLTTKDASSGDNSSELTSPKALTFDLLNMVISFKRMAIYLEPITDTAEVLRYLLGWRMPLFSMLSCILLNILFLTLSEGLWVSLLLLGISAPAVLGYLGDRCKGVTSEMAVQRKKHYAVQRRDLQTVHMSKQEAMQEVKGMLKRIDDLLTQACVYAESVYKVLYWESHAVSSMFYGSVLAAVCVLYTAPAGFSLSVLNSALFFWNKDFCRVLLELKEFVYPSRVQPAEEAEPCESDQGQLQDRTPTPTSVEDLSPGNIEEAEEAEPDDEFKDAIERNCSNCGVSSCARCCSYKVFKSSMGATAPEAQRETVFVCYMCNTFLSTK